MSLTDYLFDSLLVVLVLRQVKESRFDTKTVLLPLGVMTWVASRYLHSLPTGAADLALMATLAGAGALCGVVSGLATRMRIGADGRVLIRAGWTAAGVWVASMGARFAFAVWASHGGGPQLYRFSRAHHLDASAWTAALVFMAFGEVLVRMAILFTRSRRLPDPAAARTPEPVTV
jgi:hypothetical protein